MIEHPGLWDAPIQIKDFLEANEAREMDIYIRRVSGKMEVFLGTVVVRIRSKDGKVRFDYIGGPADHREVDMLSAMIFDLYEAIHIERRVS